MQRSFRTLLLGFLLIAPVVVAQEVPDYRGTWRDVTSTPDCWSNRVIDQQGQSITITMKSQCSAMGIGFGGSGGPSYTVDGVERTTTDSDGRVRWLTARWQGSDLIILRVNRDDCCSVTFTRQTWSLSDDGNTLTHSQYRMSSRGVSEDTTVFERE